MSHAALRTILPVAGWTTERARAVEITRTEKGISPIFRGKKGASLLLAIRHALNLPSMTHYLLSLFNSSFYRYTKKLG